MYSGDRDFLPDPNLFLEIMGWPQVFSAVKQGLGAPSDKTLRKLLSGETVRNSVQARFVETVNKKLNFMGLEAITLDKDSSLSVKQQQWQGVLFGYSRSGFGKEQKLFNQTVKAYLNADIAPEGVHGDSGFDAIYKEFNIARSFPVKQVMTTLVLFAAYEVDLQKRLGVDISNSYTLDIISKVGSGEEVWPVKCLFDSWKKAFGFIREHQAFNLRKVVLTAKDKKHGNEFYSERTFDDWVAGLYCPDESQILSTETIEWISSFVEKNGAFSEESRIQWLRFLMACNFQRLLKKYEDTDSNLPLLRQYGGLLDKMIRQSRQDF